jgi:hypothetical protein
MSRRILLLSLFILSSAFPASAEFQTGAAADVVVGQPDFITGGFGTGASKFRQPEAVLVINGKLVVADSLNNRILVWNSVPSSHGAPADVVIGQPDFLTVSSGASETKMNYVPGLATDGRKLFATDFNNNRVLVWSSVPTVNGAPADMVLGQVDFTSNGFGTTQDQMRGPFSIFCDGKRLFVGDNGNNRVLIWNSVPTASKTPADVVVGQPDFVTGSAGLSQTKMSAPNGVCSDGTRLFVSDYSNHRLLIWNSIPAVNGAPADIVLGQSSFTSNASGPSSLANPVSVYTDGSRLFVAQQSNNRVSVWESIPSSINEPADFVYGQPDPHTISIGRTQSKMALARGVFFDGSRLFVSELTNHRVLIFNIASSDQVDLGPQFTQGKALLGKVFSDADEDGVQDEGERGLEGVKVVSDTGIYAITDSDGKYHFPYIETGQRILKVDPATLPEGAKLTTESPRKTVVTEGVLTKISFGVKTSLESLETTRSGPLLQVSIAQEPVILKRKLGVRAERHDDKIVFLIDTNYASFIEEATLFLYDEQRRLLKEFRLSPVPYSYELASSDLREAVYYGLAVKGAQGEVDRVDPAELPVSA